MRALSLEQCVFVCVCLRVYLFVRVLVLPRKQNKRKNWLKEENLAPFRLFIWSVEETLLQWMTSEDKSGKAKSGGEEVLDERPKPRFARPGGLSRKSKKKIRKTTTIFVEKTEK